MDSLAPSLQVSETPLPARRTAHRCASTSEVSRSCVRNAFPPPTRARPLRPVRRQGAPFPDHRYEVLLIPDRCRIEAGNERPPRLGFLQIRPLRATTASSSPPLKPNTANLRSRRRPRDVHHLKATASAVPTTITVMNIARAALRPLLRVSCSVMGIPRNSESWNRRKKNT